MAQDNPALLWYPRDWINDTQVQTASHATQGIWMNMLMRMHFAPTRGELAGSVDQIARLIGATPSEMSGALAEIKALDIADVEDLSPGCPGFVPGAIRVRNRRMIRDSDKRTYERDRKRAQRAGEPLSQGCPAGVPSMSQPCPPDVPSRARRGTGTGEGTGKGTGRGEGSVEGGGDPEPPSPEEAPAVTALLDLWTELIGACPTRTDARKWIARRLGLVKPGRHPVKAWSEPDLQRAIQCYAAECYGKPDRPVYAVRNFFGSKGYCDHFAEAAWRPSAAGKAVAPSGPEPPSGMRRVNVEADLAAAREEQGDA